MEFQIQNPSQCLELQSHFTANLYDKLNKNSEKTWIRLITPLAIAADFLTLGVALVATIAERILKGLGNILGAAFPNNCNLLKGIQQIASTPIIAIQIGISLVSIPLAFIIITPVTMLNHSESTQKLSLSKARFEEQCANGSFFPKFTRAPLPA